MISLCAEQVSARDRLLQKGGILRGRAGSGKSTVLRAMCEKARVTVCATTARAALNVDGVTVDRLFAYARETGTCWSESFRNKQMANAGDFIALDEGSMADNMMMAYIHFCCMKYKKKLLVLGDWCQAAPVGGEWAFETVFLKTALNIRLNENHRQNEKDFLDALEVIRYGGNDPALIAPILARVERVSPTDPSWVRLFGTNLDATNFNSGAEHKFVSAHPEIRLWAAYEEIAGKPKDERQQERMLLDSRMAHGEYFKIGCRVMVTKNIYRMGDVLEFANGDTGTLVDIIFSEKDKPGAMSLADYTTATKISTDVRPVAAVIELDRTGERETLCAMPDEMKDPDGTVYAKICGLPLSLGYAFTTHKMQGITLQRACVDAGSIMNMRGSRHGLFYVAVSRATSLAGLSILNWNPDVIFCDPRAAAFERADA